MDVCFIFSWTVLFATAASVVKETKGQLDSWRFPFFSPQGRRYVSLVGVLLLGCTLALLAWGFSHLSWYLVVVNIAVAVIASFILAAAVPSVWLLYLGGFLTTGVTIFLWCKRQ
jgi:hypothetical protein